MDTLEYSSPHLFRKAGPTLRSPHCAPFPLRMHPTHQKHGLASQVSELDVFGYLYFGKLLSVMVEHDRPVRLYHGPKRSLLQ